MNWFDSWALTLAVFIPMVGVAVILALPRANEAAHKGVALVATALTLVVGLGILAGFDYSDAGVLQFDVNKTWIEVISSRYHMAVDGISLPLMILTMAITLLCVVYSWDHFPEPHNPKAFLALTLVLETGMVGTFLAQDLILFFIFFELVLLPMYFMIGVWGGEQRMYAAIKFFLYTAFGSAFMLIAFLALYFLSETPGGGHTFQITELPAAATGIAS